MDILVDYDNIPEQQRRLGVGHCVRLISQALAQDPRTQQQRWRIRLYGGWYEERSPTHQAQKLIADIAIAFPLRINPGTLARVELAYSQLTDPTTHLFFTFRKRGEHRKLRCESPDSNDCADPAHCPISHFRAFVNGKRCITNGCGVKQDDVLVREEQKLIDTMLAVDLIHAAQTSTTEPVIIVSSDHDLWPAIKQASLTNNNNVILVHTRPGRPSPYNQNRRVTELSLA